MPLNRRTAPCRLDTPRRSPIPASNRGRLRHHAYRKGRPATVLTAQLLWSLLLRRSKSLDFRTAFLDIAASEATHRAPFFNFGRLSAGSLFVLPSPPTCVEDGQQAVILRLLARPRYLRTL